MMLIIRKYFLKNHPYITNSSQENSLFRYRDIDKKDRWIERERNMDRERKKEREGRERRIFQRM